MHGFRRVILTLNNQRKGLKRLKELVKQDKEIIRAMFSQAIDETKHLPIVICASYQPEATSFPQAGRLHNMLDLCIELLNRGYPGQILYKEHPESFVYFRGDRVSHVGMERDRKFYDSLRMLGCLFVDSDFSLLTNRIECVTLNGSIGLERASYGLRTLVVAEPWYGWLPGIVSIDDYFSNSHKSMDFSSVDVRKQLSRRMSGSVIPAPNHQLENNTEPSDFNVFFPELIQELFGHFLERDQQS